MNVSSHCEDRTSEVYAIYHGNHGSACSIHDLLCDSHCVDEEPSNHGICVTFATKQNWLRAELCESREATSLLSVATYVRNASRWCDSNNSRRKKNGKNVHSEKLFVPFAHKNPQANQLIVVVNVFTFIQVMVVSVECTQSLNSIGCSREIMSLSCSSASSSPFRRSRLLSMSELTMEVP